MSATQNTVYNVTPSLLVVAMDSQALLDKFVGTIVSTHEGEPDPSAPEFPALTVLSAVNVSLKAALSTIVNLVTIRERTEAIVRRGGGAAGAAGAAGAEADEVARVRDAVLSFVRENLDHVAFNARSVAAFDVQATAAHCARERGSGAADYRFDYKLARLLTAAADRNFAGDALLTSYSRAFARRGDKNRAMQDFHARARELHARVADCAIRYQATRVTTDPMGVLVRGTGDARAQTARTFVTGANPLLVGFDVSLMRTIHRTRDDVPANGVDARLTCVGHGWRMKALMHSQTWVAHTLERVAAFEGAAQGVSVLGATPVDCDVSLQQALLGGGAGAAGGLRTMGLHVAAHNKRRRAAAGGGQAKRRAAASSDDENADGARYSEHSEGDDDGSGSDDGTQAGAPAALPPRRAGTRSSARLAPLQAGARAPEARASVGEGVPQTVARTCTYPTDVGAPQTVVTSCTYPTDVGVDANGNLEFNFGGTESGFGGQCESGDLFDSFGDDIDDVLGGTPRF